MSPGDKVAITRLSSGVPGLDIILGGGIPEYSLTVIAGVAGTGKTTLAQQILFGNLSPERRAVVFTAFGEPPLKMLRYQQQFSFFDVAKVGDQIRFVALSEEILAKDFNALLATIEREVESAGARLVVIDSFRALTRGFASRGRAEADIERFMQRLAITLTSWQVTTLLVGEYLETEIAPNPIFIVADSILWHHRAVEGNATVFKLQVVKVRGQAPMPGLHTFRITDDGVEVYPRMPVAGRAPRVAPPTGRVTTGVDGLDEMSRGGFLAGDSILVAGPAGTGKTLLATQFIAEGVRKGEHGVIAVFEEQPDRYLDRAQHLGIDLRAMIAVDSLRVVYLRPVDLSVDETLHAIQSLAQEISAQRVVFDSLSGFELAIAPSFREEFRESFYRMVGTLSTVGITVLMTVEIVESFTELSFSPYAISFLVDDIVLQRYVELDARLERVIALVKMRGSDHDHELRRYQITPGGIVIGEPLRGYRGILTGTPGRLRRPAVPAHPGLSSVEAGLLTALSELGEATLEDLVEHVGLEPHAVARALERLVALNYAIRDREGARVVHRPAVRALRQ
jgi:circadian clock protein KaiC